MSHLLVDRRLSKGLNFRFNIFLSCICSRLFSLFSCFFSCFFDLKGKEAHGKEGGSALKLPAAIFFIFNLILLTHEDWVEAFDLIFTTTPELVPRCVDLSSFLWWRLRLCFGSWSLFSELLFFERLVYVLSVLKWSSRMEKSLLALGSVFLASLSMKWSRKPSINNSSNARWHCALALSNMTAEDKNMRER